MRVLLAAVLPPANATSERDMRAAVILVVTVIGWSGAAASQCADNRNASACLDYTTDMVHDCTWCVTQGQCHTVGSVYDVCSPSCCASKSLMSQCSWSDVESVDTESCAGVYTAQVWQNNGMDYVWPEASLLPHKGYTTGVTFSGGGSRSYTCGVGEMRGLMQVSHRASPPVCFSSFRKAS